MGDRSPPKEKLAAVLAADAAGFPRLMHDDERTTVATLDEYRGVYRRAIDDQGGRNVATMSSRRNRVDTLRFARPTMMTGECAWILNH